MIFLTAQTDELYYKWQLEVQLFNFKKIGLSADNIHVLVSYNENKGLNPIYVELFNELKDYATFFTYKDTRYNVRYSSSIRPHIIKKHFIRYSSLSNEVVFFHDCDIIFRELPDIERMSVGERWYLSDTRNYIGINYIHSTVDVILAEMCKVIGIKKSTVIANDHAAGGAQYILKGVNYQFWEKVESDGERLFTYLLENDERYLNRFLETTGKPKESYHQIQSWCSDMWALLWNGFLFGYDIEIDPELAFCWPMDDIKKWESTKILHNAGVESTKQNLFFKNFYQNVTPYDIDFSFVDPAKCSIKYVEQIQEFLTARCNG